jgi:ubiquinone/menaquinone biosynthesis C-methylase UbiE
MDMACAFFDSAALFAASDLGVFGRLAKAPADGHTLAADLALDERGSRLLLDACVALGLLEKSDGVYRNGVEAAVFLVPTCPGDLSRAIRYNRDVYGAWSGVAGMVRTGQPVELPELHLGSDPERTRTFVFSMHARALGIGRGVVPMLELSRSSRVLDVGGGPGTYSVLIAQRYPHVSCTVLDLPAILTIARELIAEQGMSERVGTLAGDYHSTEFPAGVDVVNFFGVLHQESADSSRDLLRRAYEALEPGGLVHVLDMMTDRTHTAPRFSALFALNMALTTRNGWVFADSDLREWMEEAGFTGCEIIHLPHPIPHWLARARKRH